MVDTEPKVQVLDTEARLALRLGAMWRCTRVGHRGAQKGALARERPMRACAHGGSADAFDILFYSSRQTTAYLLWSDDAASPPASNAAGPDLSCGHPSSCR